MIRVILRQFSIKVATKTIFNKTSEKVVTDQKPSCCTQQDSNPVLLAWQPRALPINHQ